MKNDTSLFSLRNIKILTNMQKGFFEILVQTALSVGLFWTILKLTPKSAILSFTILYLSHKFSLPGFFQVTRIFQSVPGLIVQNSFAAHGKGLFTYL